VLFERICRENGITQRLTKPRSPTTTGKIERLQQTLQQELLNVQGPFAGIEDAQAAVDAWRPDAAAVVVPDRCRHPVCAGLREPLQLAVPSPG
jgi:transposase